MENEIHVCKGCGIAKKDGGHLCDPMKMTEAHVCEHCGLASEDPRHICTPKLQHINLFWPGAMSAFIEGIAFIHYDKTFIEILAPLLGRKPYLNFAF